MYYALFIRYTNSVSVTPIHPSVRGSLVLNLLTRCITVMNPLNSANHIKLPFSRVKVKQAFFSSFRTNLLY